MEIQIKMQNPEAEVEDKRKFININGKEYFEKFSKKWEIATNRLKPFLATPQTKRNVQRYKRTSHSFVYLGGIKEDGSTKVYSDGEKLS